MKCFFIFFLFFLTSCEGVNRWQSFPVCVEATQEKEIDVIEVYNQVSELEMFDICDGQISIEEVEEWINENDDEKDGNAQTYYTWDGMQWCRIKMVEGLSDSVYQRVFAHELGHCLGHEAHTDDPDDLMYATTHNQTLDILIEDFLNDWFFEYYGMEPQE